MTAHLAPDERRDDSNFADWPMMTPPLEPNRNAVRSGWSAIGKSASRLLVICLKLTRRTTNA